MAKITRIPKMPRRLADFVEMVELFNLSGGMESDICDAIRRDYLVIIKEMADFVRTAEKNAKTLAAAAALVTELFDNYGTAPISYSYENDHGQMVDYRDDDDTDDHARLIAQLKDLLSPEPPVKVAMTVGRCHIRRQAD